MDLLWSHIKFACWVHFESVLQCDLTVTSGFCTELIEVAFEKWLVGDCLYALRLHYIKN